MDSHRELSVHKEHELLAKLESAGLGEKEAQAVIESKGNSLAQGVVEFIRSGGRSQFSDQKSAKLILGNRCILPGDVMSKLGMKYSDKELKSLEKIPRSAELLQELRDTHILFPTASLSILETKTKSPAGLFYDQDWYNDKEFAKSERPEVRWNLVRKDRNPGSNTKTYSQQLTLLSSNEENPSAVVLVQLMVIYYQMTGIKLFQWGKDDAVRSSS
ncbi:MAG: hypothetical protein Q8L24_02105, partial [bacterium]|nr:hypothetical protein [bacterium]